MSLVGWWQLEGDASNEVGDYPSYEVGGPSYSSAKIGDGYDNTAGNATGIELIRDSPFREYEDYYSFSLWFKSTTTSGPSGARIIARDHSEYATVLVDQSTASPQSSGNRGIPEFSYSVNEWHHLVFTIDNENNQSIAYLDGDLVGSQGTYDQGTARPFVLGGNTEGDGDISGGHFVGKIDDVRLYDHILSEKEVTQLSRAKVLHYKMDTDGSVTDASGQGNDGTINGPTFTQDSAIGSGAYDFSGGNGITAQNHSSLQITGDLTIAFWAKPFNISSARQNPIHKNYTDEYTMTAETDGDLSFYFNDSDSAYNNYQAQNMFQNDNEWVHVTAVRDDGNEVVWYRNGEHWQTESWNGGDPTESGGDVIIGDGYTNPYNGILDDFRIYSEALSSSEVKELYETRASIDAGGTTHAHELSVGERESFETGSFAPEWNVTTGTLSTTRSYHGNYSFGSWGDGGVEATWNIFEGERQIDSFEYVWKEDSSQSGHVVILYDGNGNEVQESGTENPQWFLNDGTGGRFQVTGDYGNYYNIWTRFRFDFDWDAGTYDYRLEKDDGSVIETGTTALDNATGVSEIRFTGAGYGSANYNRFDQLKINDNSIEDTGVFNSAEANEIGPAPESLVGWWPLDGNTNDYSVEGNDATNYGATIVSGLGQSSYDFEESNNEYMEVPSFTELDDLENATISTWINMESFGQNIAVSMYDSSPRKFIIRQPGTGGDIDAYFYDQSDTSLTTSTGNILQTGKWYHVVSRLKGDEISLYINSELKNTNTTSFSTIASGSDRMKIGSWEDRRYFDGKIQDVRMYDRALTSEEIAQLYAITDPRKDQQMMQTQDGRALAKEQFNELM